MTYQRRELLRSGLGLAVGAAFVAGAVPALAFPEAGVRRLGFSNLHTGEALDVAYWENGAYQPEALTAVNHVLRDFRTGQVHEIEPRLLDLLTALHGRLGRPGERFGVISGYRSPATNALLHERSGQVAVHSLHMVGEAIDIRLPGVELASLRDSAAGLRLGGVGYYPSSDFVHVDIGRVRHWSGT